MDLNGHTLPVGSEAALLQWTTTQDGESAPLLDVSELQGVWLGSQQVAGPSILVLASSTVVLSGGGMTTTWPVEDVQVWPESPTLIRLTARTGEIRQVAFADPASTTMFGNTLTAIQGARHAGISFSTIPAGRVVTTQEVPGHRTTKTQGLVSEAIPTASWVAQGTSGLAAATWGLRLQAATVGANAIVAVQVSAYSGTVLVSGTAVSVQAD